jgi:hypothetical protein
MIIIMIIILNFPDTLIYSISMYIVWTLKVLCIIDVLADILIL